MKTRLTSGAAGTLALTVRRATTLTVTRAAMMLPIMMLTTMTAWAETVQTYYIDENGTSHDVTATVLTRKMYDLGTDGQTTWYVVNGEEKNFPVPGLPIHGNVNIILADGCSFQVPGSSSSTTDAGFTGTGNLTFYGQTAGTGTVSPCFDAPFISSLNGDVTVCSGKIYIPSIDYNAISLTGTFTVLGGSVSVKTDNYSHDVTAIKAGTVDIRGGSVTAQSPNAIKATTVNISGGTVRANTNGGNAEREGNYGFAIKCSTFNFSGGNVTAGSVNSAGQTRVGIKANDINLSWTSPTDRILSVKEDDNTISYRGTVTIAQGKPFKVGSTTYMGTLTSEQIAAIAGQTLKPDLSLAATGDGSAAHPYYINATETWNDFCDAIEGGETFSNKTVKLGNDITVSRIAGSGAGGNLTASDRPFCGTFDGQGNTLTFNYGSSGSPADENNLAPFRYVNNATIQHLHVSGDIYTQHVHAGGIVGMAYGTTNITDCRSSVNIVSSINGDGTHGGIMSCSWTGSTPNITGCLFDGSIQSASGYATDQCGGFVGWRNATINVSNCLLDADLTTIGAATGEKYPSATFVRNGEANRVTNSYYVTALGTAQGKALHTVTAGDNVTIEAVSLTGTATQYTVSGITAYSGGGLQRGQTLYYGSGDQLSLTLSNSATGAPQGYRYDGYTASAGTISGSTLTMPDEDVTISVALAPIDWATVNQGTSKDPYMIYNKDQLLLLAHRVNGTNGETANTYEGMYFKLGADITFDHAANETNSYAENYEAIGTYIDGTDRYFNGDFDGDGHTVSGIRIRKTTGSSDYQGLFGLIDSGADIHDVHLTDARITGYNSVGGIVGYNYGTVSGCSVTDSYITATDNWNYGTICGWNGGTLTNNYYHGCTVDGTAVTSGMGCHEADITDNNGALPAYAIALGANITTPPGTFAGQSEWLDTPPVDARLAPENGFTLAGNHYFASGYKFTPGSTLASGAAQGYTPRATLGGQLLDPYTPTGSADPLAGTAIAQFTVNADCDGKTLAAALRSTGQPVTVAYVNADGTTGEASAIALDGTESNLGNEEQETWYFVGLPTVAFDHMLIIDGNVHLILADGCTMNVTSDTNGINVNGSLTIYGQTDGTGTLNATGFYAGIYTDSGNITISGGSVTVTGGYEGIHSDSGTITISGGRVTATGGGISTDRGTINISGGRVTATGDIHSYSGTITISGGWVTVTGDNEGIHSYSGTITISGGRVTVTGGNEGIHSESGTITISGGRVTVTGGNDGIHSDSGTITLGCTTASDFIYVSSYFIGPEGTLNIADGQTLFDEDGNSYWGNGVIIPNGKTLRPLPNVLALYDSEDNSKAIWDSNGQQRNVILYGRTLYKDGSWNTLCLPFSVSTASGTLSGDNVQAMTLNTETSSLAGSTLTLNFDAATGQTIPAGTPFIIKWDNTGVNIENPVFEDVTVSNATNDATVEGVLTFTGTYAPVIIPAAEGDNTKLYLGSANKLYYPNAAMTIGTHRAYFQLAEGITAGEPVSSSNARQIRAFNLNFGDDEATGIITTNFTNSTNSGNAWYTLDGRKLDGQPTAKGLYIHGGKKVAIK